jgi:hypothetical protein
MHLPLDGGCRCERVRIRVTHAPLLTIACHCNGCKRMSSSAFSLSTMFPTDALVITKGDPVIGGLHGPDLHHHFCAYCMTWMFTRFAFAPQFVNVRATMFDEHAWFSPFVETFTSTKLPWATTGAVRAFPEFPPMEEFQDLMAEYAARAT